MTKKKEPDQLKKRGRKETVHDNSDLRSHLSGVQNLNQLTSSAYKVLRETVAARAEANNSNKAYKNKDVLFLITKLGQVSLDRVKTVIDESPLFDQSNYSHSSVKEYKRVITDVSVALLELQSAGDPLRTDTPDGEEFYTGHQVYELRRMLDKGVTKAEFEELIKKFSNPN